MPNIQILKFIFASFIGIALSTSAFAVSLGKANLVSNPGESLRIEVPIELAPDEQALLTTLSASIPSASAYERLGISPKILDFNTQVMVYRAKDGRLMVLVETVKAVPISEDIFVDLLLTLNWSTGSITRIYTFLNGTIPKFIVEPGQTLSSIASQMDPGSPEFSIDQKMMALYQANPDAFAGGNINRLLAGSELLIPDPAAVQAIDSKLAKVFVDSAAQQWTEKKVDQASVEVSVDDVVKSENRLKIGSSGDRDADNKRITEEIVAQEKILEQTNVRAQELEKNISDLKKLLAESQGTSEVLDSGKAGFNAKTLFLGLLALSLIAGLLIWFFISNSRKTPLPHIHASDYPFKQEQVQSTSADHHISDHAHHEGISDKAKALFGSINLDLPVAKSATSDLTPDELRVRLNLARAYITIEDFSAAKKSLDEIVRIGTSIDPEIVVEARGVLAELPHSNS
ncbi:FimV/HubP family polar landmark protein [Polynucleobacter sp. AP-Sving-400A-A2]|uniref:FimV/HubP family polar landmark protein n=1 Tax=Polynucleobacter sp. AP-Sving-400A-A2 TaxID=2081049 RepID=UPI001BFCF8D4|nr:FimV/HubP family polar landmark protein [Polynucleobacter sp. AP-Sving-400A-A2]QWE15461.1 pilus assembly protein FimV [Polynucleobacter sp. AP-Sving-400A-A2]